MCDLERVQREILLGIDPLLFFRFGVQSLLVNRLSEPDQKQLLKVVLRLLAFVGQAAAVEDAEEPGLAVADLLLLGFQNVVLEVFEV